MSTNKVYSFTVPDGARYLVVPRGFPRKKIFQSISEQEYFFKNSHKVRVVWDDSPLDGEILHCLEKLLENCSDKLRIKPYQTNFFKVKLSQFQETVEDFPMSNWQYYDKDFYWRKVDKQKNADLEIVRDFMINSFGIDFIEIDNHLVAKLNYKKQKRILEVFEESLNFDFTEIFIVSDYDNNLVGCYTLVNIEGDIQLHSVAGISGRQNVAKVKKLPVLMASIFNILTHEVNYKNTAKYLTFSNSKDKVSKLYKHLGMRKNTSRKGYFLEKITSEYR